MDPERRRDLMEKTANILGAATYILFAAATVADFAARQRPSSLIQLTLVTIFAFFFIIRKPPKDVNLKIYDWVIALIGTYAPLLMRPAPLLHDVLVLQILQVVGTCWSIFGIVSLNRSIGLVAADRGVKATGAYKFVRHPIYAGYFVSFTSFFAQNMTVFNALALGCWMTTELMRIFAEEKVLMQDPAYAEYAKKVRWRLLPFVF